jgi:uncharacterized protein YndB with AHSA1/START domain
MKNNKLTITINRPVKDVFAFTVNPANTSKWVASISAEETNEWPVRLGTIYRNRNGDSDWSEYEMTTYEPNKQFVLSKKGDGYNVRYSFTPLDNNITELEYYEWMDKGDLEAV